MFRRRKREQAQPDPPLEMPVAPRRERRLTGLLRKVAPKRTARRGTWGWGDGGR